MSASAVQQSRIAKVHMPVDPNFHPSSISRNSSRYKSTVHVQTLSRDYQNLSGTRRRRVDPSASNSSASSFNLVSYNRSQTSAGGQLSSRSEHDGVHQLSTTLRPSSSSSNTALSRRTSMIEVPASISSYSSIITVQNPSNGSNSISNPQNGTLQRNTSALSRISQCGESKKVSNHYIIVPQSKTNQIFEKQQSHVSCPIAYQNQINLGTITVLSDSSSDNTILHHLPDHNETTDKSHQSLHDERLHRSPRKGNHQLISTRLRSTSSIDEQKKNSIPSIKYTIEPIEVLEGAHDENNLERKQRLIREEKKRKANENEQVLTNVDEYAKEILIYLKERETTSRPKANYMRKQSELTWEMRAILIDWLSEVADEYKLFSETLHLAINFIDRFLSRMSVTKSKFQLIGTTALYLAAKCEEVYPPNAAEFAYVTDNAYTKKQVLKIEDLLLQTLNFEVSTVTTHTFLLHYLKLAEVDDVTEDLARYIAELTLLDPECLEHSCSLQAAAILCLALHMCHKPPWSNKLKQATGYTIQSFYSILEKIFWIVAKANVHEKWAITRKYRHIKHHCVASIEIPTSLPYVDMNRDG